MTRPLLAAVVLSSSLSWAQAYQPGPPPPPPPPPVQQYEADAPVAEQGRVRWGINGQVGVLLPIPTVMFGVEGRIGYQIGRNFGVYANLNGAFGFFVGTSPDQTQATVSAAYFTMLAFLGELTLGDAFFLAAGPAVGFGGWAGIQGNAAGQTEAVAAVGAPLFGLDIKTGFTFGRRNRATGRRSGFTLGIDVPIYFATLSTYRNTATNVAVDGLAVAVVPTLMFGFDSR